MNLFLLCLCEPAKVTFQIQLSWFIMCGHTFSLSRADMEFDHLWTMGF